MLALYVYGDDDYGALQFEEGLKEGDYNLKEIWDKAVELGGAVEVDEEYGIRAEAFTFGEVDPKFVNFVKNEVMDYDDSKHSNFYVVEE